MGGVMKKRINVTKTFLPPLEEYEEYLKKIWDSGQLTNQGPLLKEFEEKNREYLGIKNFHFVNNGTTALQIALKALSIGDGEVITTPFSYVATTSAILWQGLKPVFVDIDPDTLCIDHTKIESAITPNTKAIIPVHVFGNPCNIEKIDAIAQRHGIKVIYDGAHAFGVRYNDKALLDNGDISIGSFHSTKLFHTIEGGCLIVKDDTVSEEVELIKRFGHTGDEHFRLGINAKASEFQAAMGLCNLNYLQDNIDKRKELVKLYDKQLNNVVKRPKIQRNQQHNYSYYPIILRDEAQLNKLTKELKAMNVFPRRYFYPSLNKLPYITDSEACPVAEDIALRILCLPLYPDLDPAVVERITEVTRTAVTK